MRFGKTLRQAVYAPWKDKYIDYAKLKSLLREDKYDEDDVAWTENDESRFCDEIFNGQLEKVAKFQEETFETLKRRIDAAFEKLKELAPPPSEEEDGAENAQVKKPDAATAAKLKDIETELDKITTEISELKKYSNINYTGFLKIVKKHDRKRGDRYKVRPMMQLSLSQRPFNSEQSYSPLLNKLSIMYYAIRQQLDDGATDQQPLDLESQGETRRGERYTAHKFWVHPDNLLEVKTYIMRQLPALVYSEQSAKELDGSNDPTITSLYFDSPKFDLYSKKVERKSEASSLRVRWYGQLSSKPELYFEQKIVGENGSSEERKFAIKDKYIKPFIDGTYKMEKTVQKMERQGQQAEDIENFKSTVESLQGFVQENKLEPVLRANYVRTAFQKPADDRVRISIDTEVAFIREDTLDKSRPCRDPADWHRFDIDGRNLTYPFKDINQSEVSRFPYAILEIKLKEDSSRKRPEWISDLMGSHLVHPAPRFSKFVHGVASLFEDYVNNLPFWLTDLEADIRKDPQEAFEAEEQRKAQRAEDEQAVGSFLGTKISSYKVSKSSPAGKSYLADRMAAEPSSRPKPSERQSQQNGNGSSDQQPRSYGTLSSVLPGFSLSKYSKAKRAQKNQQQLPEGVVEPTEWIKNSGELKIEPKVWLANERTFLKWQHICILLGALAVSLYTAAGENFLAEVMGIVYIVIAVFAGVWGYGMMRLRRKMIIARSGKDFDNLIGPLIISIALMVALVLNFVFAYRAAVEKMESNDVLGGGNVTGEPFRQELI
ncbi:VTC domain-containing protein [Colletotrichum graminicola]|uniref:VTC domain-containing protein n=1 Tax=Colletotrichum graminicola (strain M1.001 / M2 / FGSC 10212) TaxID=645133 RepID=E3QMX1_COLGM|nr:VTC domain-containing protein [Colletotrichum graminicola M1.001]EFQ32209.1 VTC domain-containing protein [Colletotrichum graminicola M1.001]WDK09417.1 VTC domain-containing protein [Colletotrichum graminicola]